MKKGDIYYCTQFDEILIFDNKLIGMYFFEIKDPSAYRVMTKNFLHTLVYIGRL
jgi:hypothetical protein